MREIPGRPNVVASDRRPLRFFLIAAAMLHLGASLLMGARRAHPHAQGARSEAATEIAIETVETATVHEDTAPAVREPNAPPDNAEVTKQQAPQPGAKTQALATQGATVTDGAMVAATAASAETVTTPSDAATWSIGTRVAQPTDSRLLYDPNGPHAASNTPHDEPSARPPTHFTMGDTLSAHEQSLGLGASGPIVSAVHNAANSILISEGRASLVVSVDADGHVANVRAANFAQNAAEWNDAARMVAAALVGVPIRVPKGAHSVDVWLTIDIDVRYPSGAKQGDGAGLHSEGVGLGGTFDLSDLGAKPRRSVRVFRDHEMPNF